MKIPQAKVANPLQGQSKPPEDWRKQHIIFTLKQLDSSQGESIKEWERDELLSEMVERLKEFGRVTYQEISARRHRRFKIYGDFPEKSDFKHPNHVAPDARWASMHLAKEECVIGHFVANVFCIVFLDRHHRFCKTNDQEI